MTTLRSFDRPRTRPLAALCLALLLHGCGGDASGPDGAVAVTVSPREALIIGAGQVVRFTAVGTDSSGDGVSGTPEWSTTDGSVATVDDAGLVLGVATGTTEVVATLAGATGRASVEVYVPEEVTTYQVGESYFGRNGYVEYIPGELPLVFSAPHGGDLEPSEIPDRTFGATATDRNTRELTLSVREAFIELTGKAPHLVISHLDRIKLDPNREIVEAAQGSGSAEQAWREFQEWIAVAREQVGIDYGRGMYFDMHGHGHDIDRLELGYLLTASDLNRSDVGLDALAFVAKSSIRDIGRDSPLPFSQLLRGSTSFGGYLQAEGVRSIPSPSDPSPGDDAYFTGGYNTRQHGSSLDGEVVSGIQIEHHFPGLRDTDANRRSYAEKLARVVRDYMTEHFGFFDVPPSG